MILAEQLVLIALDAERGTWLDGVEPRRLRRACAAAILAELVLHGRVRRVPEGLVLDSELPDFHPLLAEASATLGAAREPMEVRAAIVAIEHERLTRRLLQALVGRDVLHEERRWLRRVHPVRSMQALREAYARLDRAVEPGAPLDAVALAHLADAAGLVTLRCTPDESQRLRRHLAHGAARAAGDDAALIAEVGRIARSEAA